MYQKALIAGLISLTLFPKTASAEFSIDDAGSMKIGDTYTQVQIGFGIFKTFGGKSSWGVESFIHFNPACCPYPTAYFGPNVQYRFSKNDETTRVYALNAGFHALLTKWEAEIGYATKGAQASPQYGATIHGILPSVSWRKAPKLDGSQFDVGVRLEYIPTAILYLAY